MLEAARLGLLPRDVEDLDPYELGLVLRGRRERERERTRLVAWEVATMINLNSRDKVTVAQLMGEDSGETLENDVDGLLEEYERAIDAQERQAERESEGWIDRLEVPLEDDAGDGDA